jgi:hypothetical protein
MSNDLGCRSEFLSKDRAGNEVIKTLLRVQRNYACNGGLELRRIRLNSLRPGGKDSLLLRSKYPVCETIGWIPVL